jgi:predicted ribosomally synthesized peptide with SipW-like signal peptide
MKKILGLTVVALMVMGMVGGGTWAYFSDPEVTGANVLAAGTLDLNLDGGDDLAQAILTISDKAPGDSGNDTAPLEFDGSIDGELDIDISGATNTESSGGTEYEGDGAPGELGANLEVAPYIDVDQQGDFDAATDIALKSDGTTTQAALQWDTLNNFASTSWDDVYTGAVTSGTTDDFVLPWRIGSGVGNTIQGDSANCTITFTLEQTAAD